MTRLDSNSPFRSFMLVDDFHYNILFKIENCLFRNVMRLKEKCREQTKNTGNNRDNILMQKKPKKLIIIITKGK